MSDWNKMLYSWDFYPVQFSGYAGWDKDEQFKPYRWVFPTKVGVDQSSRDIAIELDDLVEDLFHYRDFTDDTLPFVRDGETYRSCFTFKKKKDYDMAVAKYGRGGPG